MAEPAFDEKNDTSSATVNRSNDSDNVPMAVFKTALWTRHLHQRML
jgi:hypothetical protein